MADSGSEFQLLNSYLRSLYDILNYPANDLLNPSNEDRCGVVEKLSGNMEIRDLSFGYNLMSPPVLRQINLSIAPGESVAFIGLSGSGKTTLAKLITGLYQPWKGDVLFDGFTLNQISKPVRTSSIGVVDQEIELFAGTVKDVLSFWDDQVPLEDVIQACRLAEIHDVISERQGGYYSLLSEGGRNFSGGQRQRLEIARALIKKPKILVMDEATSALDPETEYRITRNLKALGITLVIIAHRLSTIKDCDQIIVLNKGAIEHSGKHEELLSVSPLYQEFLKNTQ